jgi:hypothetical protein
MRLVAPLVVDYSTSHRLVVVDYSAARPAASARHAARHAALLTVNNCIKVRS